MDHKGFSTSPQCAACALGSTLLVEKISNQEMICIHIFLLCLLFDLSVGAKMSNTGLHQRAKRFSQFKTVKVGQVWNDLKSSKVVSYTLTRDITVVGETLDHCHLLPVLVCPDDVAFPSPAFLERICYSKQASQKLLPTVNCSRFS